MRRYLIFASAGIILLLSSIDSTAVAVAYPAIISDFDMSLILAGWVLTSYQLASVTALPLAGKISDSLGRRTTFLGFVSLFAVASLLCSFAPNAPSLIVFRVLQGLGGSGFMPAASIAVAEEFPNTRQRVIGLFSSIGPIGWILGPNLGGLMTSTLGWRSIFWINIPLCAIALYIAARLMTDGKKKKVHIDVVGAGLMASVLLVILLGLTEISGKGTPWVLVASLISAGLIGAVVFWKRNISVKDPLIPPEILRERPFLAANAYNVMYGGALGATALIPFYAVSVYGMSTLQSGFIMTPRSIGMMVASGVVSFFLVRWGYRRPILVGTCMMIPSFAILAMELHNPSFMGSPISDTALLMLVMAVVGTAMGIAQPASNNACIELMPQHLGTIVALRVMVRQT
ncbi:MAG: MFS transporter, partial [Dehalococcoidales bacterium]|nr:MFS transporter [Dehalococcoidales bacterium]